jgi:3,4-dihydroxy 2-butanone 4-phosphate synthase/GTP cyclohydrolase II
MLGHVHQIGTFLTIAENGEMWIDLHRDAGKITKYKGSIAINGVSLTIAEIKDNYIKIAIIPETFEKTNLRILNPGDAVNIEVDLPNANTKKIECDDAYFMRLAIQEGEKGKATASPNPWTGCVIVKNDKIISTGYHKKAGTPHAEVNAFKNATISIAGATVYVTLEPCCHHGRTGPCTDLLISSKIKKVIIGVLDPDTKVKGLGMKKLQEANIEVVLMENIDKEVYEEVTYSLRQYLYQRRTGHPYVTLKIALSLDNCYVNAEGSSKWITHTESRKQGHKLRSECQAIIVGAKTAEKDDPSLTVRYGIKVLKQPLRVVIDGKSLISTTNKLFREDTFAKMDYNNTLVITNEELCEKWKNSDAKISCILNNDLEYIIKNLSTIQGVDIMHCLVEGGGKLQKSFLEQNLVNEIVIFRSSKVFGKNGYKWEIPKNIKLNLVSSEIITDENKDNNVMERYFVDYNSYNSNNSKDVYSFDPIEKAIETFKKGGFVLVMDDESRENEGDLIVAASKITENQMTEMINHTTGIICVPIERERAKKLNLPLMCKDNTDKNHTAFTVSTDSINVGTGVSSKDRVMTAHALANENTIPSQLSRPGHIYPLISHPEGLQKRQGHTESAIALCKLANIYPRVAVIGELKNQDGTMKRRQDCYQYAQSNNIPIITVQQLLVAIKNLQEPKLLADCKLKSKIGLEDWKMLCFGNHNKPHKVFVYPYNKISDNNVVPVRIHSECFTGDVFKSDHCDCGAQLEHAMRYIVTHGEGVIIFPSDHEGRGIGIVHKVKAYKLQKDEGMNTFEANNNLGLDVDARTFDDMKGILQYLGINKIELLTDNPDKVDSLKDIIVKTTPIIIDKNEYNTKYLEVKKEYFNSKKKSNLIKEHASLIKGHSPIIDISHINTKPLKIAIVYASWHNNYIQEINNQLKEYLTNFGIINIDEYAVPGSNEVPFKALKIAKDYDGIICVGILIKGDTLHFENVSTAVSNGIMQAQIKTGKPIMNCILSCLNMEQVVSRVTGDKSTLEYIAKALIKMTE